MKTRLKLKIAKMLLLALKQARFIFGLNSNHVIAKRSGITWDLDLDEGIDLSIFLLGRFERKSNLSVERLLSSGDTVIDIGANQGSYALIMAKKVGPQGRVFAIEPTDSAFHRLN